MNQRIAEEQATCSFDPAGPPVSPFIKELKVRLEDLILRQAVDHTDYVGGAEGRALYKDKDLAVQLSILEKGEKFPEHYHPVEKEWLILVKGSATVWIDGEKRELVERDSLVLEPETNHRGIVNENTTILCVSIPADAGYPNVSGD